MIELQPITPFGALVFPTDPQQKNITAINTETLTELLFQHKILVFRGFDPLMDEQYLHFCQSLGELMLWEFGALLDVRMEHNPKNHIFSQGRVELHWDGAFAAQIPRINAFQCVSSSADGIGGETLFVDTTRIIDDLPEAALRQWSRVSLSYSTEKKAHYGGAINIKLIEDHPHQKRNVVRFIEIDNEDNLDVNPVQFSVTGLDHETAEFDDFVKGVTAILYDPRYMYRHRWVTGDYMLIDNNSVLHGRAKVEGNAKRHLKRVHIL